MSQQPIPEKLRSLHDPIAALIEPFCAEHLNEEYRVCCMTLLATLARKRPTPLVNGKPNSWACGIIRAIGFVNFLDDKSQKPHMKSAEIDKHFGVSTATGQARSKLIRDLLKIKNFEPAWTLPSRLNDNPLVWLVQVNGFLCDARHLPREIQEDAVQRGIIPYLPPTSAENREAK
jgi:hypothetical protein